MLYCPNVLGSEEQNAVLSQKTQQNQSFQGLQVKDWDSTAFLRAWTQNIGTVQRFLHLEGLKCCTVPIFLGQ